MTMYIVADHILHNIVLIISGIIMQLGQDISVQSQYLK